MGESRTKTVKASEARQHFAELVNEVFKEGTRVVVEKSGVPVAVLVSARELPTLERSDRDPAEFMEALAAIRAPFKDIPPDKLQREIDKAVAEVRAEMRAEREAAKRSA